MSIYDKDLTIITKYCLKEEFMDQERLFPSGEAAISKINVRANSRKANLVYDLLKKKVLKKEGLTDRYDLDKFKIVRFVYYLCNTGRFVKENAEVIWLNPKWVKSSDIFELKGGSS